MFDIGFWELTVIAIVALLVVGPEELPTLARTTGRWIGKARRFMGDMKNELENEVDRGKELKERIAEETKIAEAHRALNEASNTVSAVKKDLREAIPDDLLKPVHKAERDRVEPEPEPEPESEPEPQAEPDVVASQPAVANRDDADKDVDKKEPSHGKTS